MQLFIENLNLIFSNICRVARLREIRVDVSNVIHHVEEVFVLRCFDKKLIKNH